MKNDEMFDIKEQLRQEIKNCIKDEILNGNLTVKIENMNCYDNNTIDVDVYIMYNEVRSFSEKLRISINATIPELNGIKTY